VQFLAADEAVEVIAADEHDGAAPMDADEDMEDSAMTAEEELTEEERKQREADDAKTASMGTEQHFAQTQGQRSNSR
jgi:hypothetical protein